jgi:hypothetical protein
MPEKTTALAEEVKRRRKVAKERIAGQFSEDVRRYERIPLVVDCTQQGLGWAVVTEDEAGCLTVLFFAVRGAAS